jgi:hypothetical protein
MVLGQIREGDTHMPSWPQNLQRRRWLRREGQGITMPEYRAEITFVPQTSLMVRFDLLDVVRVLIVFLGIVVSERLES